MPCGIVHRRGEARIALPSGGEILQRNRRIALHQCQHRRAESGGFTNHRPVDRNIDDVGEELHQPVICGHPAIDPHHGHRNAVTGDGGEQVVRLVGDRLQRRPNEIRRTCIAGNAIDCTARVRSPVRRAEAGQGRDHIDAVVAGLCGGDGLGLAGRGDQLHAVAKPLDNGAGNEDRAFQRIGCPAAKPVTDGGQQLVIRRHRLITGVDDHEAAGAVGGLQRAGGEASLADSGGLLVTCHPADREVRAEQAVIADAELGRAIHHLRQAGARHVEQGQQLVVPVIFMDIVKAGSAGVGGVGDMHPAAGQPPDQEAVDGAETQLARGSAVPRAFDLVEDPGQFRGGEIGVQQKAGLFRHHGFGAGILHHRADVGGATVLPDDGVVDRPAGGAVPDDCGLALVGDADGHGHAATRPRLSHHGRRHIESCLPDILWIVLDPAVRWEMLWELGRLLRQYRPPLVKQYGARASGSLVDSNNGAKI